MITHSYDDHIDCNDTCVNISVTPVFTLTQVCDIRHIDSKVSKSDAITIPLGWTHVLKIYLGNVYLVQVSNGMVKWSLPMLNVGFKVNHLSVSVFDKRQKARFLFEVHCLREKFMIYLQYVCKLRSECIFIERGCNALIFRFLFGRKIDKR